VVGSQQRDAVENRIFVSAVSLPDISGREETPRPAKANG
jgi:hypothetical protein